MEKTSGPPPSYGTDNSGLSPPSYDEAAGPPPSYASLFGEIKEARQGSSSVLEFTKRVVLILLGTIGCTIFIGLFMAIPIAMIVIGAKYKDECRVQRNIPIYLIVAGSVGVFRNLISLGQRAKKDDDDDNTDKKPTYCTSLLDTFMFVWFIFGNVWIYHNYQPDFVDRSSQDYCNQTLYMFAFWITTATYIIMGVGCCCFCCVAFCAAVLDDGSGE